MVGLVGVVGAGVEVVTVEELEEEVEGEPVVGVGAEVAGQGSDTKTRGGGESETKTPKNQRTFTSSSHILKTGVTDGGGETDPQEFQSTARQTPPPLQTCTIYHVFILKQPAC